MYIRKATQADLATIMQIYKSARALMRRSGNATQWGNHYPSEEIIKSDIANNYCHLCINDEGETVGVFCFFVGNEPTYNKIYQGNWLNDESYGVIHRIASFGKEKGIAAHCIQWCINQHTPIRIDTHHNNHAMHHILTKLNFTRCGIIYLEDGSERVGYEL